MYLSLNGVTVSIALDSVSLRWVNVGGEEERSPSGSLEGGPLVQKREWAMATTPVPATELDAWVGLIEGKGHVFPFDVDLYSTRGRGPVSSTGAALASFGVKHGAGYLFLETPVTLTYETALPSTWTAVGWTKDNLAFPWKHRVIGSDGTEWADAVLAPGLSVGEVTVVDGSFTLAGADGTDFSFDDMVVVPYLMPSSWVSSVYTLHNSQAWSALPRLYASGDFASSAVTVRGKVTDVRAIRYAPSGTITNGYTIQFTLREV